jgi:cell division protein FtsI/penicillin-binding protein 2
VVGGIVLFGLLTARLVDLQILRGGHFASVAEAQRKRASELLPHRGTIYATEGRGGEVFPIASNQKSWIAYAVPRDMSDPGYIADELAPALLAFQQRQQERVDTILEQTGQREDEEKESEQDGLARTTPTPQEQALFIRDQLLGKFDQRTDPYEPFLRPYEVLDDEFKKFLEEKQLPGIVLEEQEIRIYPEEELAAHILGYVGFDGEKRLGRYGIEGYFEDQLRGDFGWLSGEHDTSGRFIGVAASEFRPAQDGSDIVLTIDRVVQSLIEKELEDGVKRFEAERGSVIVMNPATGAVLGMATYPTYDPNTYYAIRDPRVQSNPAVSDIFEPGSILKPLVMAGAIEEELVDPETTFVDSGPVRVAEYLIDTYDGKHHGRQTMTEVLEQSNNVGMVWVSQQLGTQMLYDYLRRFGLGERTGIELEGETQTNLLEPKDWNITTVATVGFGQGVALTPVQALNAVNAIANDGHLMQPYIVSRIRSPEGEERVMTPQVVRQAVSETTAGTISAMMVSVIENGVAQLAGVPGYYLAGKTGTAQVADETGKYSKDRKIISFVGFGPVPDPQFSILIKLDNPTGLSFASGTAAPMFRNIAAKLLNYYQIPPSYDDSVRQPTFKVTSE